MIRTSDQIGRTLPAVGMIILLLVYVMHGVVDHYLVERVKNVGMFLLSIALMLLFVCVSLPGLWNRLVCTFYRHQQTAGKRISLMLIFGLASVNQMLMVRHAVYRHLPLINSVNALGIVVFLVLTLASLILFIRVPETYTPLYILALIWGVLLRIMLWHTVPYDPNGADMLFCIDRSCESLLQGVNPYGQTYFVNSSHSFPLVYFPLLWLPYLPFKALSLDLRWFNFLAQLVLFAFFWFLTGRNNRSAIRSMVLILLILIPDMIAAFFDGYLSHYWLLGALYLWLIWREHWKLSLLAVCGLVLMRITALTTLEIYLLYVWKRRSVKIAVRDATIAAAALALSLAPFAGVGIRRFEYLFHGRFLERIAEPGWWQIPLHNLAIGGALQRFGLAQLILPLQIIGLLSMGLVYGLSRDQSYRTFAGLTALAYAYFIWLSDYVFSYYWVLPVVLLAALYLIETRDTRANSVDQVAAELSPVSAGKRHRAMENAALDQLRAPL